MYITSIRMYIYIYIYITYYITVLGARKEYLPGLRKEHRGNGGATTRAAALAELLCEHSEDVLCEHLEDDLDEHHEKVLREG